MNFEEIRAEYPEIKYSLTENEDEEINDGWLETHSGCVGLYDSELIITSGKFIVKVQGTPGQCGSVTITGTDYLHEYPHILDHCIWIARELNYAHILASDVENAPPLPGFKKISEFTNYRTRNGVYLMEMRL